MAVDIEKKLFKQGKQGIKLHDIRHHYLMVSLSVQANRTTFQQQCDIE